MRRLAPLPLILGCQPVLDEHSFPLRYAEAVCAQEAACDASSPWLQEGEEVCVEQVAGAWFVPREVVACEPFSPAKAQACVDAIEAAGCGARETLQQGPAACADITSSGGCPVPGFVGVARAGSYAARVRSVRPGRGSMADPG